MSAVAVHATETFTGAAGLTLFAQSWRPANEPRGVLVIVHGLRDHRYTDFAAALVTRGYAMGGVIVALFAEASEAGPGGPIGVILSAPAIRIDTLPLAAAATRLAPGAYRDEPGPRPPPPKKARGVYMGTWLPSPVAEESIVGSARPPTEDELRLWRRRVGLLRRLRGYELLWGRLDRVRDVEINGILPAHLGKMYRAGERLGF